MCWTKHSRAFSALEHHLDAKLRSAALTESKSFQVLYQNYSMNRKVCLLLIQLIHLVVIYFCFLLLFSFLFFSLCNFSVFFFLV